MSTKKLSSTIISTRGAMNEEKALQITGGLSSPSKMPCKAYSIPAKHCKVGAKLRKILNSTCRICYAFRNNFNYPNVVNAMARRYKAIKHKRWVEAMVYLIKCDGNQFFRWHDSGDLQSFEHLDRICQIATLLPNVSFWLPSREYKMIGDYIAQGGIIPPNLTIRLSAYMIDGELPLTIADKLGAVVSGVTRLEGVATCPAPKQGHKCMDCRKCWDKRERIVIYGAH